MLKPLTFHRSRGKFGVGMHFRELSLGPDGSVLTEIMQKKKNPIFYIFLYIKFNVHSCPFIIAILNRCAHTHHSALGGADYRALLIPVLD